MGRTTTTILTKSIETKLRDDDWLYLWNLFPPLNPYDDKEDDCGWYLERVW